MLLLVFDISYDIILLELIVMRRRGNPRPGAETPLHVRVYPEELREFLSEGLVTVVLPSVAG